MTRLGPWEEGSGQHRSRVGCLGANRFGQDRSPLSLGFDCMHPLNEVCLDADQSEIMGRSVFLWGRGLIVIEMPVLSVAG
jgi:hypothetical protein